MTIEQYDSWLEPNGPVAVTVREDLEPVMGKGAVFFPPTFAPPKERRDDPPSYVIDETSEGSIALVDSVGSQANRIEPIFKHPPYSELVPTASIKIGAREIDLLDAGHRAADAIVRFSDKWKDVKASFLDIRERGDATKLARLAPTSLVFGVWDSRDTQVKLPRLIGSTIRAYKVDKLTRAAQFFAVTEKDEIEQLGDQDFLSNVGLDDAPAGRTPGGVISRDVIRREGMLNLIALRALKANDTAETRKLQRYILGLALIALLAQYPKFLREGCLLVPSGTKGPEKKLVDRTGLRSDFSVDEAGAMDFAKAAAGQFGVGVAWTASFEVNAVKASAEGKKQKATKKGAEVNRDDLRISVTFLAGRYHGDEWPPSPAKLFQALVAATHNCRFHATREAEAALLWLEQQPAPSIRVCESRQEPSYRIAVPNNDMDVIAKDWAAGKQADPAKLRTMKDINPKQMLSPGPHVQYIWHIDEASSDQLEVVRDAVHRLHTLGWGIDMAYADCSSRLEAGELYEPSTVGERLPVPMPGTLYDLRATYSRFTERSAGKGVDTHTRPTMLRLQAYREKGAYAPVWKSFVLLQPDSDLPRSVPWRHCMKVAGWLRHAAAGSLRGDLNEALVRSFVLGHPGDQEEVRRLSYVPLPSLHSKHGDGMIRRVMVVEPVDSEGEVVSLLAFKLSGTLLLGNEGTEECVLAPSGQDDWVLRQYTRPALSWRSVTPVILHGHNLDRHGSISVRKTERLLLRAFEMAGIAQDRISSLAFQAAPLWSGARHSSAMLVPDHFLRYPRLHVEVRLKKAVRGPVLAGIGRHYGIGLFAAADA